MGFYGNVFYELSNAFASILIKSKHGNKELKALGTGGSFSLKANDDLIELDGNEQNRECIISHAKINPEKNGEKIIPFQKVSSGDNITQLNSTDIIAVPSFEYDDSGHIIKTAEINFYKMPTSQGIESLEIGKF